MGCTALIDNIGEFTQTLLRGINKDHYNNNIGVLNNIIIEKLVRDSTQDIVYNPENPYSRLQNFPLFYFIDCKNNAFVAYNKNLADEDTIKTYNHKEEYGCLLLLSNTKKTFTYNVRDVSFTRTFSKLTDKVGYGFGSLMESY